jgi:hypothetical protein
VSNPRAIKYRRLALAEHDQEKARLLQQLADESDRGVLCTADWLAPRPLVPNQISSSRGDAE